MTLIIKLTNKSRVTADRRNGYKRSWTPKWPLSEHGPTVPRPVARGREDPSRGGKERRDRLRSRLVPMEPDRPANF